MHIGDLRAGDMVDFHYIVESMYMYVILIKKVNDMHVQLINFISRPQYLFDTERLVTTDINWNLLSDYLIIKLIMYVFIL